MRKALFLALALASLAFAEAWPKVRAITAFIRIDAADYEAQVAEAVKFLASSAMRKPGQSLSRRRSPPNCRAILSA